MQSDIDGTSNRLDAGIYDDAGNLTEDAVGRTFGYDAENRQIAFEGGMVEYFYDGEGQRVKKESGAEVTIYVYNFLGQLAVEYGTTGNPELGDKYVTVDHLGSTRVVTSQDGQVDNRYDYLPFGEEIATAFGDLCTVVGYDSPDDVAYKFTGKERDEESALDYFRTRYLSAPQGPFTSVDPVKITPGRLRDLQQVTLYSFVRNNPFRFIDPDGEILQITGDVNQDMNQMCELIGSDCSRISFDEKTNTIAVDVRRVDLQQNEGALPLDQIVNSQNVYDLTLDETMQPAGGPISLLERGGIANLDGNSDRRLRYRPGGKKTWEALPPAGKDSTVAIYPSIGRRDMQCRSVLLSSLIFHEHAEAYANVDRDKQYINTHILLVNGQILIHPGADKGAIDRERRLRDQRPYLKETGPAGDRLIRDPVPRR